MPHRPLRYVYLRGAAALAGVAALLAIVTVLQGDFGETEGDIFATIGVTFVAGSALLAGIACLGRGSRLLGLAGIALAVGGFVLWAEQIWADHDSEAYWKVLGLFGIWTLVTLVGTTSALMTKSRRGLHVATVACAAGAGLTASIMLVTEEGDLWQLFAVLLILTLLGEILTPILERSSALEERPAERELGSLGGVTVVAVRGGKRVVRIGDREAALADDESVVLRQR
jgi:hypothetical protein